MVCMTHKHESSQASLTLQLEVYLIFPASFPFSPSTILASPSSPALSLALWHGGAHDLSNKEKKNKKQTPLRKTIHIQLYKSLTVMLQKRCLTMARPANVSAGDENRSKEENA